VLIASILYFTTVQSRVVLHELLITVFVLMTAPVVSMLVMRAAIYRDLRANNRDSGVASGGVYRFPDQE
jgi:multicomponent K+:H+ antiporter subunit G